MVHLDNELMANDIEMEEWNELTPRQQDLAEDIVESVMEYGEFDKGFGANGAHYFDGKDNAFKADNIVCSNCIFFDDMNNKCLVVSGNIDPEGICKLWIIPEEEFTETPEQEAQEDAVEEAQEIQPMVAKSIWGGSFNPLSINKIG